MSGEYVGHVVRCHSCAAAERARLSYQGRGNDTAGIYSYAD